MSDDFDRILRDGSTRFSADLNPPDAHLVRARGDQRRKRKTAGSLAIALVIVVGSGTTAYALGQPGRSAPTVSPATATATATPTPGPIMTHTPTATPDGRPSSRPSSPSTTTPSSSSGAAGEPGNSTSAPPTGVGATKTLQLGHLTLRVPEAWRVTYRNAQGDYTVSTGACAGEYLIGAEGGSACATFSLILDAGSPHGKLPYYVPGVSAYTTSTGATGCPGRPASLWLRTTPSKPYYSGYAPVTSTKTAYYTVWELGCVPAGSTSKPSLYFQQRDWYLPESNILIVDEYATPGLAQILATAIWR